MCPKPITSKKLLSLINDPFLISRLSWDNQATFSKLRILSAITDKLQNRYYDFWHKLLFNDDRVIGGNKLRTYRKIKTDYWSVINRTYKCKTGHIG
jgi:hypothetical protein